MHVGCPSCGTKYVLPPNKAQAGLKVRCKRCSVVFSPPIAGEAGQGGERGKTGRGMPGAPKAAGGEETAPAAPAEEASDPTSEGSAHPTGISEPEEGPGKAENPWGGVAGDAGVLLGAESTPQEDPPGDDAEPFGARGALSEVSSEPAPENPYATTGKPGGEGGHVAASSHDHPEESSRAAAPPRGGSGEAGGPGACAPARAVGLSAIRAQSQRPEPGPVATSQVEDEPRRTGWRLRVEGKGDTRSFRDLESVRAWMAANPGPEVLLSSDGVEWRRPEEILGLAPSARPKVAVAGVAGGPRSASAARRIRPAGPIWTAAALLSTACMLLMLLVAAQNLGLADLKDVVPFDGLGLGALLWSPAETPEEARERARMERYRSAMGRAEAAREGGRILDAVLAYELALESHEGQEALEGLLEAYREIGDPSRIAKSEERLRRAREGAPKPPHNPE